jgi:large subunit ribosomal protein L17
MRHRVSHRKLGRVTEHRIAMLRNQASALLKYEHIETTMPKAKELRPFVERIITIAKRGLAAGADNAANARTLHARRLVLRDIQDRDVVSKLFDTIAPRFEARPGGYTRILRLGYRRGDSAEVAQIELVGSEYDPNAADKGEKAEAKKPTVGGRLRAAAQRLRGRKADAGDGESAQIETKQAKPARAKSKSAKSDTRGKAKTTAAPRKAGGS